MTDQRETFGRLVAADDAVLMDEDVGDIGQPDALDPTVGTLLWSYVNEGRINGIPVADEDRGLKIDSDELLSVAFVPDRRPCSMLVSLSPDDDKGRVEYESLLQRVYDGEVLIVDENKQFDAAKCRFVDWIRYDEIRYVLHPRFEYLREE